MALKARVPDKVRGDAIGVRLPAAAWIGPTAIPQSPRQSRRSLAALA
jgi:hypothetical protein